MLVRHLATPRSIWMWCETTPCVLATPEVCLGEWRKCPWGKSVSNPRSVLAIRRKWPKGKSGVFPRSLFQVPENDLWAKTGRGPEDNRKTPQRLLAVPEDALGEMPLGQKSQRCPRMT